MLIRFSQLIVINPNPYAASAYPGTPSPNVAGAPGSLPWPAIWFVASVLSLALFVLNDPWAWRDGIWFEHLARALPFFFLTPLFAYLALRTAGSHRRFRKCAIVVFALYLFLPLTWRFADRVDNQLIPVLWFGG